MVLRLQSGYHFCPDHLSHKKTDSKTTCEYHSRLQNHVLKSKSFSNELLTKKPEALNFSNSEQKVAETYLLKQIQKMEQLLDTPISEIPETEDIENELEAANKLLAKLLTSYSINESNNDEVLDKIYENLLKVNNLVEEFYDFKETSTDLLYRQNLLPQN